MDTGFWLTNILLEIGYEGDNGETASTKTDYFHLSNHHRSISNVLPASEAITDNSSQKDARGMLALPSFKEILFQIHLRMNEK